MKTARRIALIAAVSLGLVGAPPAVQADHQVTGEHEATPTPPVPPDLDYGGLCLLWLNRAEYASPMPVESKHDHLLKDEQFADCWDMPGGQDLSPWFGEQLFGLMPGDDTNFPSRQYRFPFAAGIDGPGDCVPPGEECETGHGAGLDAGWSHSSCYAEDWGDDPDCNFEFNSGSTTRTPLYAGTGDPGGDACVNCGEVMMFPYFPLWDSEGGLGWPSSTASDNWFKFCRGVYDLDLDGVPDCSNIIHEGTHQSTGGHHALAWGALTGWTEDIPSNEVMCFFADLTLTAHPIAEPWTVNGVAQMWLTTDDTECDGAPAPPLL